MRPVCEFFMFLYFQHLRLNTSCIFSFISGAGGSWITWSKTVAALAQDLKKKKKKLSLDRVQVQTLEKRLFFSSKGLGGMWLRRG